jgi:N-acetylglucosaminyldiphosphoundecaprenol N-acetyl-beta-D-mannosaminyltransferase
MMDKQKVSILGIKFENKAFNEMFLTIKEHIIKEEKRFIVTANPEIVMYAKNNRYYNEIIQSADYVVPDGNGIIMASTIIKTPLKERVTGFDLMMELLNLANDQQLKVYLLGGKQEINKEAVSNINRKFPNLQLVGSHHGYFDIDQKEIPNEIENLKPDLIFVALGFPRQEEWISKYFSQFQKGIFIGVGGSIDVISGRAKRAPLIWQNLKVEWLYRLLKQPSRWKRMLVLPKFLIEIFKFKKKNISH